MQRKKGMVYAMITVMIELGTYALWQTRHKQQGALEAQESQLRNTKKELEYRS